MDPVSALFFAVGIAALIASWLLLLIYTASEDFAWGLCTLLLPPLSYLYGLTRLDKTREPMLLALAGLGLIWLALG
ncbi:MAG: hypothetical protein RBS22_10830 [Spongiibacteraceae bacterium]|jgi:hypothetical protein|nr:hypothetical protein [Spongiibacteraceae bacterium]